MVSRGGQYCIFLFPFCNYLHDLENPPDNSAVTQAYDDKHFCRKRSSWLHLKPPKGVFLMLLVPCVFSLNRIAKGNNRSNTIICSEWEPMATEKKMLLIITLYSKCRLLHCKETSILKKKCHLSHP